MTLADLKTKIIDTVKDASEKLTSDDYDRNITAALNRYSRHKPGTKVADVVGNGTHDYDLPSGWTDEFSDISRIEYPIGDVPATVLDADVYEIYQTPTGKKLRLKEDAPLASESFRVSFTILRTAATIPAGDADAFVWLAAALCCEDLANAFAQTENSIIAADAVDYKDKSSKFASRAKRLMQLFKEHLGLKEDDSTAAASAIIDMDVNYPGGWDRLTHPRRQREKR